MFYTIYKTTNLINGKFYIGKHKTNDPYDDYLGSGKLLNYAIKKYGRENFVKEILCVYDNEKLMNLAEKILVVIDSEVSYNICKGGHGGWGFVNSEGLNWTQEQVKKAGNIFANKMSSNVSFKAAITQNLKDRVVSDETRKKLSYSHAHRTYNTHNEATKKKISQTQRERLKSTKHSQYGTCWITNNNENKKVKKDDLDLWYSLGFRLGRMMKS